MIDSSRVSAEDSGNDTFPVQVHQAFVWVWKHKPDARYVDVRDTRDRLALHLSGSGEISSRDELKTNSCT